jgi:hypothetical protein
MRGFYSPFFLFKNIVGRALITPIFLYLPKFDKSKNITVAGQFGNKIKELRETEKNMKKRNLMCRFYN